MDGGHIHSQCDGGKNGLAGGVRDVVEFQVEKNAVSPRLNLSDDGGTFRCEKLEPDLENATLAGKLIYQLECGFGIGGVNGDDDFLFGSGRHGVGMVPSMTIEGDGKVNLPLG